MPGPVGSCRESISACSANDQQAEAIARKLGVVTKDVTPAGASARETKERQRVGVASGAGYVGAKLAEHEASHAVAERLAGRAYGIGAGLAAAVGPLLLAKDLGSAILRAKDEGEQLKTAYQRDILVLVSAYASAEALPPGYVSHVETSRAAIRGSATKVVTDMMRSDETWGAHRKAAVTDARAGATAARSAGLASEADLAAFFARDPGAARRYEQSSAYRHGIDAVIWQASQGAPKSS